MQPGLHLYITMKQVQTLIFTVLVALACVHVCQAGFPFGGATAEAECSAASVLGLEQCRTCGRQRTPLAAS